MGGFRTTRAWCVRLSCGFDIHQQFLAEAEKVRKPLRSPCMRRCEHTGGSSPTLTEGPCCRAVGSVNYRRSLIPAGRKAIVFETSALGRATCVAPCSFYTK